MKSNKKALVAIFVILVTIGVVWLFSAFINPSIVNVLTRCFFSVSTKTSPHNLKTIENRIEKERNISYKSEFKENNLDVYSPKSSDKKAPVIIWVHGGAFVGGDKEDVSYFASALAEKGYVVVAGNYGLAPEVKFPDSVNQIGHIYEYLKSNHNFSGDLSKVFFAGDSAGANMVAKFIVAQASKNYSDITGIVQVVPRENIKGVLLYCGVYDLENLARDRNNFIKFILEKSLWSYFGQENWEEKYAYIGTIKHHVTENLPPFLITDGNSYSFSKDAEDLEEALKAKGVEVRSYYTPKSEANTYHEYQFKMNTESGKAAFEKTVNFLEDYSR